MKKLLAVTLLLVGCSVNASAQEFTPYVGADVNYGKVNFESGVSSFADDSYKSFTAVLGSKVHENVGVEMFYQVSLDEHKNTPLGKDKTSFDAYGVDVIGYQPILCGDANLLASFGIGQYDAESKHWGSEESLGYRFGVGAEYLVTEEVAIRAMARHVIIDDITFVDSMNEVSVGIRYAF